MAIVLPFRGILFNPQKIDDLSMVTTPPFDVISEKQQHLFYESHPNNMVRLILGKEFGTDTPQENRHTRAAAFYRRWIEQTVLVRDSQPALYLTAVDFQVDGRFLTRYGLICLVGIEPFERGVILPHEKTFTGVKSERLDLMRACHANFSPIFSLYADKGDRLLSALQSDVGQTPPVFEFTDGFGMRHRLWRVLDPRRHRFVTEYLHGKPLFIADGHHRYETALNYRRWVAEQTLNFNGSHPANHVMMYLSSMENPGLVILPAHRLLKAVDDQILERFLERAREFFDIETIAHSDETREQALDRLQQGLRSASSTTAIGVSLKNQPHLYLLTLKAGTMDRMFADELPDGIRHIDVTVLTRLVFMEVLGFDHHRLDNEKLIGYATRAAEAVETVRSGAYDMAFILNPTRMSQVQEVARQRLIMPRKATYFYPKVVVGQVINPLVAEAG